MRPRILSRLCLTLAAAGLGIFTLLFLAQQAPGALAAPQGNEIPVTTAIQAAINSAQDGDTILIGSGTYNESLTINKTITLTGVSSDTTIIQAVPMLSAISVDSGKNLRLQHLSVTGGNTGGNGGGISVNGGSLWVEDCRIYANHATMWGGGIYLGSGSLVLQDSVVEENVAMNSGGGIFSQGSLSVTNSAISNNQAISAHGGGIYQIGIGSSMDIDRSALSGNAAGVMGGGAYVFWGTQSITRSTISGNVAHEGGGLFLDKSGTDRGVFSQNTLIGNTATGSGSSAGITIQGGLYILENNLIAGNIPVLGGAVLSLMDTNVELTHLTFSGVITGTGVRLSGSSIAAVKNSIFDRHATAFQVESGSTLNLDGMLYDQVTAETAGTGTIGTAGHLLHGDPLYREPETGDYHLSPLSPARDAGIVTPVTQDLDGALRPVGEAPDLGAYEYPVTAITGLTASSSSPTTLGETTYFTATAGQGNFITYTWDFGDSSGPVTGAQVAHTYPAVGEYQVGLLAENELGAVTTTLTVEVLDVPIGGLAAAADGPTTLGQATHFTASVSAGTGVSYTWDFGDGTPLASGAAADHSYAEPGEYTVKLTAQNTAGQQSITLKVLVVQDSYGLYLPLTVR